MAVAMCFLLAGHTAAQDRVTISSSSSSEGRLTVSGRIVDYSGAGLVIESEGASRTLPLRTVQSIETHRTDAQLQGDAAFAAGKFTDALVAYRSAREQETRAWVRRELTAQIVWCYRALGQISEAARQFLLLVRDDPATPYFDCIPLAWRGSFQTRSMIPEAKNWLREETIPAAVLLGASYLLQTEHGTAAVAKLQVLAKSNDANLSALARAQAWRPTVISARESQVQLWQDMVEDMPAPLRAGPYYVVGQGWARCENWTNAALAFTRIPILYPKNRELASQSLFDAAMALGRLERHEEANRLYRELIANYPESPLITEAESRMK